MSPRCVCALSCAREELEVAATAVADAQCRDARRPPPCAQSAVGVDNTVRRKWDKDEYAAKAAERVRLEVRARARARCSVAAAPQLLRGAAWPPRCEQPSVAK